MSRPSATYRAYLSFCFVAATGLAACKTTEETSQAQWAQDHEVFKGGRGHEDLIRMGVDWANEWISLDYANDTYNYPSVEPNQLAEDSTNQIVLGSLATDLPNQRPDFLVDLNKLYGLVPPDNLWDSTAFENLHFMRSYSDTSVTSAQDACQISRENIILRTTDGLKLWNSDRPRALFLIGHALHAVQDSFSAAHNRRSEDARQILDICIWKKHVDGVCYHAEPDIRDIVWDGVTCLNSGTYACLKPLAQKAVTVSAGFLYAVAKANADGGSEASVRKYLLDFFDNDSDPSSSSGYFRCDHLR